LCGALLLLTLWEASISRLSAGLNLALQDNDPGIRAQAEEFLQQANAAGEATVQ
jgi:hypothetical protein